MPRAQPECRVWKRSTRRSMTVDSTSNPVSVSAADGQDGEPANIATEPNVERGYPALVRSSSPRRWPTGSSSTMKPDGIQRSATYHRSSSNAVNANPKPPEFQRKRHAKRGTHQLAPKSGASHEHLARSQLAEFSSDARLCVPASVPS